LPRPGLSALAWFSLAPLILACSEASELESFGLGTLAGFSFHGFSLFWIYSTCRFAGIDRPVSFLAWAALAAFLGLAWGLGASFARWLTKRLPNSMSPWIWAASWTAVFVILGRFTPRVSADLLEYTQYGNLAMIQLASIFGPFGLGFLILLANASLAAVWKERARSGPKINLAVCAVLVGAAWIYGEAALVSRHSGPGLAIEILQPNIDQYRKWDMSFQTEIEDNLQNLLSLERTRKPALIVWPESVIPRWVMESGELLEASPWSRQLGAYQIIGVVSEGNGLRHNSALLIGPDGAIRGKYFKRVLVPFGEFVPFPWLKRWIGILNELGGIDAGESRQELFKTPLGLAAPSLCYEATFQNLARLDAQRGARLIVNLTNDGWYKDTWGPDQHFGTNVFRAVENRVTVIRAANTGISGVIDPWGVVTARLGLGERGRLSAEIPALDEFPGRSFYAHCGDWFGNLVLLLSAALVALANFLK
jgi:apolipoprotein N-acyltransferase